MNKFFFFLCCNIILILKAQVPQGINYQAVVRNNNGVVLNSASVNVKFELYSSPTSPIIYSEVHNGLPTGLTGVVTCTIGFGAPSVGTFSSSIDWSSGDVWYRVFVDIGTGYNPIGAKQKFMTVPFSFYAHKAENASYADEVPVTKSGNILTIGTTTVALNSSASITPTITGTGGTIVSGTYPTLAINSPTVPNYTAGTGIAISGNVISNTILPQPTSWIKSASTVTLANISDKVGIGTNNPASSLEVVTSGALLDGLRITNTDATVGPSLFFKGQNQDWTITGTNSLSGIPDKLVFRDYSLGLNRMVIDNTGNIGVGTNNPTALLHLVAPSTSTVALLINNGHIQSTQTGTLSLTPFTQSGSATISGYSGSVTFGLNPTDTKGIINISTSSSISATATGNSCDFSTFVKYSKSYINAPVVVITPLSSLTPFTIPNLVISYYVSSGTTGFTFHVTLRSIAVMTSMLMVPLGFNYFVIE